MTRLRLATLFVGIYLAIRVATAAEAEPKDLNEIAKWCPQGSVPAVEEGAQGCVVRKRSGGIVRVGRWEFFARNTQGLVMTEVNHDRKGLPHGETIIYYASEDQGRRPASGGDLIMYERMLFEHGKPHGTWTVWYREGQRKEERAYRLGKLHGLRKRWDSAGHQISVECFSNGERISLNSCSKIDFDR